MSQGMLASLVSAGRPVLKLFGVGFDAVGIGVG